MQSPLVPTLVIAAGVVAAYALAGVYGIAVATTTLLSLTPVVVSIDAYGPVTDNAGGIAEMAQVSAQARDVTDALDAAGNSTKALTKVFAIGSAGLAALALFVAFKMEFGARVEEGSIITYRKHWYFLLQGGCFPILASVAALMVALLHWVGVWKIFSLSTVTILAGLTWIFAFILFLLAYWEWRNDYYQITDTQLVDFKKIILGPEQRHTAPLTEIRSVDYEHPGFLARLLNFGNVYIYTGGDEPLVFQDIANPAQAQYDIFLRLDHLQRRREMDQWARERQRFIEWLATYHKLAREAFRPPSGPSPSGSSSPSRGQEHPSAPSSESEEEPPWAVPPPFPPG